MFGIGFGELIVILLAVFLLAPKEIPRVLKKTGEFFRELDRVKRELLSVKEELAGVGDDADTGSAGTPEPDDPGTRAGGPGSPTA